MATSSLVIQIGANTTAAGRAIGALSNQIGGLGHAVAGVGQIAAGFALGGILAGMTTGVAEHFKEAITATTTLGQEVFKLNQIIGGSTESTSALLAVFHRYGVETQTASNSLGIFSKRIAGIEDMSDGVIATGKSFTQSMHDLGVSFTDGSGKALPMNDVLLNVADKFAQLGPGADRTAIALQLFGRAGKDLIPVLALGRAGLEEAEEAAAKYGLTLSSENVAAVRSFGFAHKDLEEAMSGVSLTMGNLLLPVLTSAAKAVAADAQAFNQNIVPAMHEFGDAVNKEANRAATDYDLLSRSIERVNTAMAVMGARVPAPLLASPTVNLSGVSDFASQIPTALNPIAPAFNAMSAAIEDLASALGVTREPVQHFGDTMGAVRETVTAATTATQQMRDPVQHLGDTMGNVSGIADELTQSYINQHSAALSLTDATNALIAAHTKDQASQVIAPLFSTDPTSSHREAAKSLELLQTNLADTEKAATKAGHAAVAAFRPFGAEIDSITRRIAGIEVVPLERQLARMLQRPINPNRPTSELPRLELEKKILELRGVAGGPYGKSGGTTVTVHGPVVQVASVSSPADEDRLAAKVFDALLSSGKNANTASKNLPGAN